jgi:hypothetical protein
MPLLPKHQFFYFLLINSSSQDLHPPPTAVCVPTAKFFPYERAWKRALFLFNKIHARELK